LFLGVSIKVILPEFFRFDISFSLTHTTKSGTKYLGAPYMPREEFNRIRIFGTLPPKENKQEGIMEMEKCWLNYMRIKHIKRNKK